MKFPDGASVWSLELDEICVACSEHTCLVQLLAGGHLGTGGLSAQNLHAA